MLSSFLVNASSETKASRALSACFYGALITNLFGAVLSCLCARWFAMLSPSEAEYFQECCDKLEQGGIVDIETTDTLIFDCMVRRAVQIAQVAVWSGFGLFISGMLILVWMREHIIVSIFVSVLSGLLALFIPPFILRHGRRSVISRLRIKRRSGNV